MQRLLTGIASTNSSNAGKVVDQPNHCCCHGQYGKPQQHWRVAKLSFGKEACLATAWITSTRLSTARRILAVGHPRVSDPSQATPLMSWIKGTESGMDNSQRFDANVTSPGNVRSMLAVDFSTFFALDTARLALIAKEIGNQSASKTWSAISSNMSSAMHELLWDKGTKLYMDRHASNMLMCEKYANIFDHKECSIVSPNAARRLSCRRALAGDVGSARIPNTF